MTSAKIPTGSRTEWLGTPARIVVKVGSGVLSHGGVGLHRPTLQLWPGVWPAAGAGGRGHPGLFGAILAGMEALGLSERPRRAPLKQRRRGGARATSCGPTRRRSACGGRVAQILLTQEDSGTAAATSMPGTRSSRCSACGFSQS